MKGISTKAKFGWAFALAFGFLAFMVVMAAQTPAWGIDGDNQLSALADKYEKCV